VVGRCLPSGGGLPENIEFIEEIPFYWKVQGHLILCDNNRTVFSMAGISYQIAWCCWKKYVFSVQKGGKRSCFSDTLARISSLTQWTPCTVRSVF